MSTRILPTLTVPQMFELARRLREFADDRPRAHWHFNNCGCCVTVHGADSAYVIDSKGEATHFDHRGCSCE
jgi:hypothetical protein